MSDPGWEPLQALALGMLTSIQPCPLAANAAAVSVMIGWTRGLRRALLMGLSFLLGAVSSYILLGMVVSYSSLSIPAVANLLQQYGNRLQGPLLILAGMLLANLLHLPVLLKAIFPTKKWLEGDAGRTAGAGFGFVIGSGMALAFCPTTAAIFFGLLIPLAVKAKSHVLVPAFFGLGTGLPLLAVVLLAAKGTSLASHASWVVIRKGVGVVLILLGLGLTLRHVYGIG